MTDTNQPRPNPLLQTGGRVLEELLNRALALDDASAQRLTALEGRRIELHLQAPKLAMAIEVADGRMKVGPANAAVEPDLSLRATLGALLSQALPGASASPVGQIRINGDAELAQHVQRLLRDFSPDLDAALARVFGDVIGVQMARALRSAFDVGKRGASQLARDGADYLVEERRDIASRVDQEQFFDEVDTLRDDVERMAARVDRLREQVRARADGASK